MPVGGRKPKPPGQAVNRMPAVHDWTEVPNAPFKGGPGLPAKRPDGRVWPASTRRWWKTLASMPHCSLWSETDWAYAEHTARLVASFDEGDLKLATEIRNREKVLGTTADYRRDLRIRYIDPKKPEEGVESSEGVARLDDYRSL